MARLPDISMLWQLKKCDRPRSPEPPNNVYGTPVDILLALVELIQDSTNDFQFVKDTQYGFIFEAFHTFTNTRPWLVDYLVEKHGFVADLPFTQDGGYFDKRWKQRAGSVPLPPFVVDAIVNRSDCAAAAAAAVEAEHAEKAHQARVRSELRSVLDAQERERRDAALKRFHDSPRDRAPTRAAIAML